MAKDVQTKREREKEIVSQMIALYCRKNHKVKNGLCSNCKVHCYKPEMREKIRVVMCFSGPRMLFYHPVLALFHVIETKKEKRRLEKYNEN